MTQKDELAWKSALELSYLIRTKKISPVEVVEICLERIDRINPIINAFCTLIPEQARESAKLAESQVMKGISLGPLHGIPIAIKDLTPVKGVRLTMGSKLYAEQVATEDAIVVKRIKQAGGIIVGMTNTPEFGFKGTTDNLLFGATRNPWKLDRISGGSSGGSSAAVAAGLVPFAEGSDGGGSIRIPAAICGVYGYKATYGRIPYETVGPFYSQAPFIHFGPIARTVSDAALLYSVMDGSAEDEPFTFPIKENIFETLETGIQNLKVAYCPDLGFFEIDPEVRKACDNATGIFKELGCIVEEVNPRFENPKKNIEEAWATLWYGMVATSHGSLSQDKLELLDPKVQEFIKLGKELKATEYIQANKAREEAWSKLQNIFKEYDIIICPTTAVPAFSLDTWGPTEINGKPINPFHGWFLTYPINLTGHPAASIPCGFSGEGLPIGLQIIGRRLEDETVFRASRAFERLSPWSEMRPQFQS
ncbi:MULTISPECIES: amidase [Bacillus]|nr:MULTISPECIES: amidase [Bacillus]